MTLSVTQLDLIAAVCDDLESALGDITACAARQIKQDLPTYRALPDELLEAALRGNLALGITSLRELRAPDPAEVEQLAATAADRALQGIPLDAVLHAYRIGFRVIWARIPELAAKHGLDVETALAIAGMIAGRSDTVMEAVSNAHHDVRFQLAREDQQRRDTFLRALLAGTLHDEGLAQACAGFGLDLATEYVPARVRPNAGAWPHGLPHRVELALGGRAGVVGQLDGDTVAIATIAPDPVPDTTTAIGPAARPADLPASFALTTRVLQTACAYGLSGTVALGDLSIRPAVLADQALGELFEARYLQPLEQLGRLGEEIRTTLRTWLSMGMRYEDAARALHVHPNTLRHRLRRFEELTECTLRDFATLVEIWWALERAALAGASTPPV